MPHVPLARRWVRSFHILAVLLTMLALVLASGATVPVTHAATAPQPTPAPAGAFATANGDGTETIQMGEDAGAVIPATGDAHGPVHQRANCFSPDAEVPNQDPATFTPEQITRYGLPTVEDIGSLNEWQSIVRASKHALCAYANHYQDGQPVVNGVGVNYEGPHLGQVWSGWVADAAGNTNPYVYPGGRSTPCPTYCGKVTATQGYIHVPGIQHLANIGRTTIWMGVGGTPYSNSKNCTFGDVTTGHGLVQAGIGLSSIIGGGASYYLWHENTGSGYPSCGEQDMIWADAVGQYVYSPNVGDDIHIVVAYTYTSISDLTTGIYWPNNNESPTAVADSSECVVEHPTGLFGSTGVELDYGTVQFQYCRASINGLIVGVGDTQTHFGFQPSLYVNSTCDNVYDFTADGQPTWYDSFFNVQYSGNDVADGCVYW